VIAYYYDLSCEVSADKLYEELSDIAIGGLDGAVTNAYQIDFHIDGVFFDDIFHIQQTHDENRYELRFGNPNQGMGISDSLVFPRDF